MDDLEHTASDRGFIHMGPVAGTDGTSVRAYESSAAFGPFLWVRVGTSRDQAVAHAHLPLEAARLLRDQLTFLLRRNGMGEPPAFNPAHVEAAVRLACETQDRTEEEQRALMELAGDLGGSVVDLVADSWSPVNDLPLHHDDRCRRGD